MTPAAVRSVICGNWQDTIDVRTDPLPRIAVESPQGREPTRGLGTDSRMGSKNVFLGLGCFHNFGIESKKMAIILELNPKKWQ